MSTWYDDYWSALKTVIAGAWPEIPAGQLFNENSLERKDWQNLLNDKEMTGAWVAVEIIFSPSANGPINGTNYDVTPTIYYIAPLSATTAPQTMTAYLIDKMDTLRKALKPSAGIGTLGSQVPMDAASTNPVNVSLLAAKLQWQAASITPTMLYVAQIGN